MTSWILGLGFTFRMTRGGLFGHLATSVEHLHLQARKSHSSGRIKILLALVDQGLIILVLQ